MPKKFRNRYRAESHRRPGWDYFSNGLYFLTIVTQHRVCDLGEVVLTNGLAHLRLSGFGKIVEAEWYRSFEIRQELLMCYGFLCRDIRRRYRGFINLNEEARHFDYSFSVKTGNAVHHPYNQMDAGF